MSTRRSLAAPDSAQSPSRPPAWLLDFAAIWLVGVIVRRGLFAAINGSLWPFPPLPLIERLGLMAIGLLSGAPSALLITLSFALIAAARRLPPAAASAVRVTAWAVAASVEFFAFASWATYSSTGEFLNADLIRMFVASPLPLFEHIVQMNSRALVAVPVVATVVLLVTWSLCRWVSTWRARPARRLLAGVGAATVTALVVAALATPASMHGSTWGPPSARDAFVSVASDRSGPIARLLADLLNVVGRPEDRLSSWTVRVPASSAVITPEAWARRVDPRAEKRRNVIIVVIESLRADELAVLGGARVVMPTVEMLAHEGTVYSDAVTPAAHSEYATTSLLSSQYPLRQPMFEPFPKHPPYPRVLLWDLLKPLGWRTAVFSSQNEYWQGMYDFLQTGSVEHFLHAETFGGPTYADANDYGFTGWMKRTGHAGKIDDRHTIDEAIAWTDTIAPTAPFLAYVNLQSSHTPYMQPQGVAPRFGAGRVSFKIVFGKYPADSAARVRDLYDNALAYADAQLGRLVAALKHSGRWGNTVMIVLGDHGEAFYEHGFGAHGGSLFREVTHIPLVIRVPGAPAHRDWLPAASIDVPPTVLGLLRLPPHPGFQGMDLADLAPRLHRPLFSLSQSGLATEVAVEQDHWKLRYNLRSGVQQLFDLYHDPLETKDVADAYPVQRHELFVTIGMWWSSQLRYYRSATAQAPYYAPVLSRRTPLAPP